MWFLDKHKYYDISPQPRKFTQAYDNIQNKLQLDIW